MRASGSLSVRYYGEGVPAWRKRIAKWEAETGTPISGLAMVEREADFPGLFPV